MLTGIIPLVAGHLWCWIYTKMYFPMVGIPPIPVRDYLVFDRMRLQKLNPLQKIGCLYCQYANGVTAWFKAVANMTEIYSCAIKQSLMVKGQEHQKEFHAYEKFL